MAPECMTHKQYSEASDAFSYGVLLWVRRSPSLINSPSNHIHSRKW